MTDELNRRQFITASTALAMAASALSGKQRISPNDRVTVGIIGTGDQGTNHLRQLRNNPRAEVRAICDIYGPRLEKAREISSAATYTDYRELLAREDLDCVWIATPDHWHSRMGIDALEAGKDVYCEKPMGRYWHEARDFARAAKRTGGVVQIGAQQTSHAKFHAARELVADGALGQLISSQVSFMRNARTGDWNYPIDHRASRTELDWEAFLGPAEPRPFDPERYFRWRKYWDYSGGVATDLLSHPTHPMSLATGNQWPVRAVAAGGILLHPDREVPDTFHMMIDYTDGHSLIATGAQTSGKGLPVLVRGHRAWLEVGRDTLTVWPEQIYIDEVAGESVRVDLSGDLLIAHHDNFLDCVLTRNRQTNCPPELGYRVALALDMANRSWREERAVRFDPATEDLVSA